MPQYRYGITFSVEIHALSSKKGVDVDSQTDIESPTDEKVWKKHFRQDWIQVAIKLIPTVVSIANVQAMPYLKQPDPVHQLPPPPAIEHTEHLLENR